MAITAPLLVSLKNDNRFVESIKINEKIPPIETTSSKRIYNEEN